MDTIGLKEILGIIATFITLLLSIFIFSAKSNNKLSNKLFGFFLLISAIEISGFFLHHYYPLSIRMNTVKNLTYYLLTPTFYLYVCSVCYSNFTLKKKHLWHLLPFIVGNLIMLPRFYLSSDEQIRILSEDINNTYEQIFTHIFMHIQSIYYYIASFVVIKRARKIFIENYSNNAVETYKWLYQIVLFWMLVFLVALIKNIFKYMNMIDVFPISQVILSLALLLITCWYVLKALKHPELFSGVDSDIKLTQELTQTKIDAEQFQEREVRELKEYMQRNEPYLDPSLTIRNLASQMKIPMRDLSILINKNLNQHFFDFVNEYRIKKAMNLLKDTSQRKLTVLEILYEVGFNSKSSFNTAFKKYTNLTPTQFRKQYF